MAFGSLRFRGGAPKNINKISFRIIWKVISNHPFLVATLLYLIILQRHFPLLFSLLVSASPVLICTALLLGTLLIHGQQQNHSVNVVNERNVDDRSTVADSLNNGVGDFTYSADKDGIFSTDEFGDIQNDVVGKEVAASREFDPRGKTVDDFTRLSQRSSNQIDGIREGFHFADFDLKDVQTRELPTPNFDEKYDKTVNVRHGSAFISQKLVDSVTNRKGSYSTSDGAEKFSLDVLVAEVTPTPRETHPLLGSEDPRHLQTSQAATFKSETQSLESIQSSENSDEESIYRDKEEDEKGDDVENDETPKAIDGDSPSPFAWTENDQRILQELRNSEIEKNEHLESLIARAEDDESEEQNEGSDDVDDDDDVDLDVDVDVDDEEENVDLEKDGGKHVTLWTEEDEKNLRHLGCSELERNLRLENLLVRRRVKRNFSMISEKNLIDLDKFVPPSPIPPILTTRVSPFDNFDDTSHHSSAPPIPGSAPSVTLPRKNPFDSPSTSPKSTQNLGLDGVKESSVHVNLKNAAASRENGSSSTEHNTIGQVSKPELVGMNRKENLFRRYESFSSGFNITEESSSTHDFLDFDRKNFVLRRHETFNTRTTFPSFFNSKKPVFVTEQVAGEVWHPSLDRQLSQDTESVESGTSSDTELSTAPDNHEFVEHDLDNQEAHNEVEHDEFVEHDLDNQEAQNEVDHTSNHMETGSESSEVINSEYDDDQDEHHVGSMEMNVDNVYQNQDFLHDGHNDHDATSSSSSSEHDADSSVNETRIEQEQAEVSGLSPKNSLNMSEVSQISMDDDHLPVEPIYDTSPSGAEKITAFTNPAEV
ncbi:hypothetical protein RND81_10G187500 [Saponaria officinalis]|uniref:Uncharacterized protein n=1 Tax=Saponaria officinalis TaxID=3572 RepID=A0AAW1I537_SAPOF